MAQEKIIIKFEPKGHKPLIDALNKLALAQKAATGEGKVYNSTAGLGVRNNRLLSNSFATLRSKLLLVNFAMAMGIKQLIGFSREASKLGSVEKAFNTLAGATEDSSIAIEKLRSATDGTMSSFDLFKQANNAMILGVSNNSDEMAEMFDIAQRLGRALGQDTAMSVESLVTGIGRQSRLMLDNIGIMVKAEEAYDAFANKLGISTDQLTDAQKKQAFFNAAMKGAKDAIAKLGAEQLTSQDKFDQFGATLDDFQSHIGRKVTPVVLGFLDGTAKFMKEIMETDLETALRQMRELGGSVEQITILQKAVALDNAKIDISKNVKVIKKEIEGVGLAFSSLSKEQIESLGGTFEMVKDGSLLAGKSWSRVIEAGDPLLIQQETVQELLENNLATVQAIDADNIEATEGQRRRLLEQNESLSIILQSLIQIANAQNIIAGKPLLPNIIGKGDGGGGDDGGKKKIKGVTAETKLLGNSINAMSKAMESAAINGEDMGQAVVRALQAIAAQLIAKMAVYTLMTILFPGAAAGLKGGGNAFKYAMGIAHKGGLIKDDGKVQRFATGGSVRGGDNVPILAQGGEFVMSRSAVESVGIENLNRMNQGGGGGAITVNVSGNVLTEDFVTGELADNIKEAVRRGTDFGIS